MLNSFLTGVSSNSVPGSISNQRAMHFGHWSQPDWKILIRNERQIYIFNKALVAAVVTICCQTPAFYIPHTKVQYNILKTHCNTYTAYFVRNLQYICICCSWLKFPGLVRSNWEQSKATMFFLTIRTIALVEPSHPLNFFSWIINLLSKYIKTLIDADIQH